MEPQPSRCQMWRGHTTRPRAKGSWQSPLGTWVLLTFCRAGEGERFLNIHMLSTKPILTYYTLLKLLVWILLYEARVCVVIAFISLKKKATFVDLKKKIGSWFMGECMVTIFSWLLPRKLWVSLVSNLGKNFLNTVFIPRPTKMRASKVKSTKFICWLH